MMFTDFISASTSTILRSGVCVKKCPENDKYKWAELIKECKDNTKKKCEALKKGPAGKDRTPYATMQFVRYCLPKDTSHFTAPEKKGLAMMKKAFMESKAGTVFNDLWNSSRAVYTSMALALFWSIVFIYIMSIFAEPLAWCCVVLVQLGLIAAAIGSYFLWKTASDIKAKLEKKAAGETD